MKKILILLAVLMLTAACGDQVAALPPALGDTQWQLTAINGEAPVAEATLAFNEDASRVSGTTGCNTYGGDVTLTADRLTINPIEVTEMACIEPEGVMQQEQTFLNTMQEATSYDLTENTLTITAEGERGETTLTFER